MIPTAGKLGPVQDRGRKQRGPDSERNPEACDLAACRRRNRTLLRETWILPRLLGSPEAFGQYSLAMSIANVVDNVLIAATVQSLSKRVSENEAIRIRVPLPFSLSLMRRSPRSTR